MSLDPRDSLPIEPLELAVLPKSPRVSIAIIAFNYGRFLGECLDSCIEQTHRADEIVVVDDGSTDHTQRVLDAYVARASGVRSIHQPNGGICSATNAALAACSGDVVLLLDADDVMAPDRIEKVLAALGHRVDGMWPGWVHHRMRRFSETDPDLGQTPYYANGSGPEGWLARQAIDAARSPVHSLTSALAFRRELLQAIGTLDADRVMYQDMQLIAAATLRSPAAWIGEPLTRYRIHGTSASADAMVSLPNIRATRQRAERVDVWLRSMLEQAKPGTSGILRPLDDQGHHLWLAFLERWLSGAGKDFRLLWRVLRHPDTRRATPQNRLYYYAGAVLPRPLFVSYSRLVFGSSALKARLRQLTGRR